MRAFRCDSLGAASVVIPPVGLDETDVESVEAGATQGLKGWPWNVRNHTETCSSGEHQLSSVECMGVGYSEVEG